MASPYTLPKGFALPHLLSGLDKSSSILVGFSGGADSSALLHMLCEYGKQCGAKIYAAHINHGIRGSEADRDEDFCRKVCKNLDVEFFSLRADVPAMAKEIKESVETAARNLRYSFFDGLMREHNIPILATAHNANDNIETMIFNLARGSSLSGMCGIPPTRPCGAGLVIRPVLEMTKDEIYEYCKLNGIDFVTDSTNTDTDYTRNKIRTEIIPILTEINSGAIKNVSRVSRALRADSLCLDDMQNDFTAEFFKDGAIKTEQLNKAHEAVANRSIVAVYNDVSSGGTLEYTHINAIRELSRKAVPHSSVTLPKEIEAVIEDGRLVFRKIRKKTAIDPYNITLIDGKNYISQTNCEIIISSSQNPKNIYKNSIFTTIDFDKISGGLFARSRLPEDKILLGGMHKSVKKLMCEKKIPVELRPKLPIICDDEGILAIPSVAVRDKARVGPQTENPVSLQITFAD